MEVQFALEGAIKTRTNLLLAGVFDEISPFFINHPELLAYTTITYLDRYLSFYISREDLETLDQIGRRVWAHIKEQYQIDVELVSHLAPRRNAIVSAIIALLFIKSGRPINRNAFKGNSVVNAEELARIEISTEKRAILSAHQVLLSKYADAATIDDALMSGKNAFGNVLTLAGRVQRIWEQVKDEITPKVETVKVTEGEPWQNWFDHVGRLVASFWEQSTDNWPLLINQVPDITLQKYLRRLWGGIEELHNREFVGGLPPFTPLEFKTVFGRIEEDRGLEMTRIVQLVYLMLEAGYLFRDKPANEADAEDKLSRAIANYRKVVAAVPMPPNQARLCARYFDSLNRLPNEDKYSLLLDLEELLVMVLIG